MPFIKSVLLICGLFLCSFAFAQNDNFWKYDNQFAYKKIQLGSDVAAVTKVVECKKIGDKTYDILDATYLSWGDIVYDDGNLHFKDGKFGGVQLITKKYTYDKLLAYYIKLFGDPTHASEEMAIWKGKKLLFSISNLKKEVHAGVVSIEYFDNYDKPTLDNL